MLVLDELSWVYKVPWSLAFNKAIKIQEESTMVLLGNKNPQEFVTIILSFLLVCFNEFVQALPTDSPDLNEIGVELVSHPATDVKIYNCTNSIDVDYNYLRP